jgi:hypothetical protein
LARNYESTSQKKPMWENAKYYPPLAQSSTVKDSSEDKQPVTTRWEKGECFKCQEPWTPRHNKICKFKNQVHLIALEDDECTLQEMTDPCDNTETQEIEPELQISLHALSGTCTKAQTLALFVYIGDVKVVALIDSGSTTTFLDPFVIEKDGISVSYNVPKKVTIANGGTLWTEGVVTTTPYIIQGHKFKSDFWVLQLSGYDMILERDWIYDHSLVGINLKTREFSIEKSDTLQG